MTAEHATVLANLVLGKVGCMAANNVWAAITKPSTFVLREVAAGRRPSRTVPGRLRAPIPFDWDVLEISVEGFRLRAADAWISLRINSFAWPRPPAGPLTSFTWLPSKDDAPGKVRKKIDKPPPFSGTEEVTGGESKEPIDTNNDPSKGSEAVWVKAPGARQDNAPELVRGAKETSYVYEGERRKRRRREVGSISTGNAVPGPTGAANGQAAANNRKPGSTRFAEVLAMFGRLAADARIEGYQVYVTHMFVVLPAVGLFHRTGSDLRLGWIWYPPILALAWALGWAVDCILSTPANRTVLLVHQRASAGLPA